MVQGGIDRLNTDIEKKQIESISFTINYADGTKKEVSEGVMFEFIGQAINVYVGTHRTEALAAVPEMAEKVLTELEIAGLKQSNEIKLTKGERNVYRNV